MLGRIPLAFFFPYSDARIASFVEAHSADTVTVTWRPAPGVARYAPLDAVLQFESSTQPNTGFVVLLKQVLGGSLFEDQNPVDFWFEVHNKGGDVAWTKKVIAENARTALVAFFDNTVEEPYVLEPLLQTAETRFTMQVVRHPNKAQLPGLATTLTLDTTEGSVMEGDEVRTSFGHVFRVQRTLPL